MSKKILRKSFTVLYFFFIFLIFVWPLPLVFNESISGHLDIRLFTVGSLHCHVVCESHLLLIIFYRWQRIWALQQWLITVFIQRVFRFFVLSLVVQYSCSLTFKKKQKHHCQFSCFSQISFFTVVRLVNNPLHWNFYIILSCVYP